MKANRMYAAADVHNEVTVLEVQTADGSVFGRFRVPTVKRALMTAVGAIPGEVYLTFEEGNQAAWLYDIVKPLVADVLVCDPRHAKKKMGDCKSDDLDPHELCNLLRSNSLKRVFHGSHGLSTLKQQVVTYQTLTEDSTRLKNRLRAVFGSRGIKTKNQKGFFLKEYREEWLGRLDKRVGEQHRAMMLFRYLDVTTKLRKEAQQTMVEQARKYKAWRLIRTVPGMGDIRAAQVLAKIETPFRFRTKRQLWKYAGFAITTIATGEYKYKDGKIIKVQKKTQTRGLNRNHCPQLKNVFKGAAVTAASRQFKYFVDRRVESGKDREIALVDLARKIAAIVLAIWKKGEPFELDKALMHQK